MGIEIPAGLNGGATGSPITSPETVMPREVQAVGQYGAHQDEEKEQQKKTDKQAEKQDEKDSAHNVDASIASLQPFGYDLFAGTPSTFAPATDIPVPVNYVIGPGDTIVIQLYGKENATHELIVTREGIIQFPGIGPISINGLDFAELRERINNLVSEQMIGVKASVTMGALRSIHVFVLGEAYRPGTYTISSLSTMTHALFASGGIKTIGSLRNIQLKRRGETVATLDLYDLLLKGDTSNDLHLLPGDVIFIPTVGTTAAVAGEVRRPAIYELKGKTSADSLIALAGGYQPTAYPNASRIARIDRQGNRTVVDINLNSEKGKKSNLRNGDVISVYSVLDKLENIVLLSGHVHRPGYFTWRKGMRVSDVIHSVSDLKTNPDLTIGLIKQKSGAEQRISFKHFNPRRLLKAKAAKKTPYNPRLKPRDEIILFEAGSEARIEQLAPYIKQLELQTRNAQQPNTVTLAGSVKAPGTYPLTKNMNSKQLIALGGGLTQSARNGQALLITHTDRAARYEVSSIQLTEGALLTQSMSAGSTLLILNNESPAARKALLEPLIDEILSQSWHGEPAPVITVDGPVRFPGNYPYIEGMEISDLITLAGGLREEAYLFSAEVTRRHIDVGSRFEVRHHNLDLGNADERGLHYPLQARDKVVVKQIPEWGETISVSIQGEVRFPGIYPIVRGETLVELIERAGGLTDEADPLGAVFLRESLKEKEAKALEEYKEQLEAEIVRLEQEAASSTDEIAEKKAANAKLLENLDDAEALGRLVINLPQMLEGQRDSLVLRENDELTIPGLIQEVSILGEVHQPTSYLYERGINAKAYLKLSGNVTRNGDAKRAYLISRAGTVKPLRKWQVLWFKGYNKVNAGDTIVVPVDADKISTLSYWMQASQVLFQLATTAAALETVGAL